MVMRKKLLLGFSLLFFSALVNAQSIRLLDVNGNNISNSSINVTIDSTSGGQPYEFDINVLNLNPNSLDVNVRRSLNQVVPVSQSYFCWDQCYTPIVDSSIAISITGQDTLKGQFHTYFKPRGQAGSSTVRYTFFDVNHRSDSANFTLHILATNVVGIKNIAAKSKNKISTAYPNPSINNTSITYSIENPKNTLLVLYDVLGKEVWSKKPENTEGIFQLNTSSLQAGIYFYSLLVDNVSIVTKKLIVTEK